MIPGKSQRFAYTIDEAASLAGCGRDSLYDAIREGRLVARKLGRRTLLLHADFAQFLETLTPLNLGPESARSERGRQIRQGGPSPVSPKTGGGR